MAFDNKYKWNVVRNKRSKLSTFCFINNLKLTNR